MANVTRAHRACDDQLHRSQARIKELESQLAEAKSGWDSCIADLREAGRICKEAEDKLAACDWSPISQDNLPRARSDEYEGDEVWRDLGKDQGGVAVEAVDADMQATWTFVDYKLEYWSHRRPINAPAPTHTGAKYE